jgi:hypothetical protein
MPQCNPTQHNNNKKIMLFFLAAHPENHRFFEIYIYIYVHTYTYMGVYIICTHIYEHIYIYSHTYTHIWGIERVTE